MCVCVFVCVCVCMYLCTCIYTQIHTYTLGGVGESCISNGRSSLSYVDKGFQFTKEPILQCFNKSCSFVT